MEFWALPLEQRIKLVLIIKRHTLSLIIVVAVHLLLSVFHMHKVSFFQAGDSPVT